MLSKIQSYYNAALTPLSLVSQQARVLKTSAERKWVDGREALSQAAVRRVSQLWAPLKRWAAPAGALVYSSQAYAADLSTQVSAWAEANQAVVVFGGLILGQVATISPLVALWRRQIRESEKKEASQVVSIQPTIRANRREPQEIAVVTGNRFMHRPTSLADLEKLELTSPATPQVLATALGNSRDLGVCLKSFELLYKLDSEMAVRNLVVKAKTTNDAALGWFAMTMLAEKNGRAARDDLVMLAHHANLVAVRDYALWNIYKLFGDEAYADYVRLAWGGNSELAMTAISLLARRRDAETLMELKALSLNHRNQFVRDHARYKMAQHFGKACIPILVSEVLNSRLSRVDRLDAIFVFQYIAAAQAETALEALSQYMMGDTNLLTSVLVELAFARARLKIAQSESDVVASWPYYVRSMGINEEQ